MNGLAHEIAAIDLAQRELETERERRGELRERHVVYDTSLNPLRKAAADMLRRVHELGKVMGDKISQRDELDAEVRTLAVERNELKREWRKLALELEGKQNGG
jgi:chromosome segregation ATPase